MESLPLDIWQHHILPRLRDRRALRFVSRFCHALLRPALPDAWSCFSPVFATAMMREGWHLRPKVLHLFAQRYEREEAAYSWTVGSLCGRRDRVLIERVDIDNWGDLLHVIYDASCLECVASTDDDSETRSMGWEWLSHDTHLWRARGSCQESTRHGSANLLPPSSVDERQIARTCPSCAHLDRTTSCQHRRPPLTLHSWGRVTFVSVLFSSSYARSLYRSFSSGSCILLASPTPCSTSGWAGPNNAIKRGWPNIARTASIRARPFV